MVAGPPRRDTEQIDRHRHGTLIRHSEFHLIDLQGILLRHPGDFGFEVAQIEADRVWAGTGVASIKFDRVVTGQIDAFGCLGQVHCSLAKRPLILFVELAMQYDDIAPALDRSHTVAALLPVVLRGVLEAV